MYMLRVINQTILGYILSFIALFLNYYAGMTIGVFCAVLSFGAAYFGEGVAINVTNENYWMMIGFRVVCVFFCVASYAIYFGVAYHVL